MPIKSLGALSVALLYGAWAVTVEAAAAASQCGAESGRQRASLLELYTSEGCNSCPPADIWLSRLRDSKAYTGGSVVPLAYHVDYWNYLGWHDRFSQPLYAQRQRAIARHNRSATVYTPQFVFNGRDFRRWRRLDLEALVTAVGEITADAQLSMRLAWPRPDQLNVTVETSLQGPTPARGTELRVAIYENGLTTAVQAGENAGRELRHDFVVRELSAPRSVGESGSRVQRYRFAVPDDWKRSNLGVAAFVERRADGGILQALARSADCRAGS